jgi:catechol 2,3-dioxygenase
MRTGSLAHVTIGSGGDADALARFYRVLFGVVEVARRDGTLYLSGGKSPGYDVAVAPGEPGLHAFAFELAGADDLAEAERRLERAGTAVRRLDAASDHGLADGIEVVLPSGHAMQLVVLAEPAIFRGNPTVDPRHLEGAGPVDLEHLTIDANDVEELTAFLVEHLDFRVTEYSSPPGGPWFLAFLRATELHHDLGVFRHAEWDGPGFNHVGFTVPSLVEIGRVADIACAHGWRLQCSPGRHLVGNNLFIYLTDPSGNRVEVGTPMVDIAPSAPTRAFDSSSDAEWGGFDGWRAGIPPAARTPGRCRDARGAGGRT